MPDYELSPLETRVLGCLMEKERTTPENYPLSLNALTNACNQSTNREPVVAWDEKTVEGGVNSLRSQKLAVVIFGAGSRVQKYRHNLAEHYEFSPADYALLCVLMLRGPQTAGELRTRCERMHPFSSLEAVEQALEELARGDDPLVRLLPARPGQKERRYIELFSAPLSEEQMAALSQSGGGGGGAGAAGPRVAERVASLEGEVQQLRAELQSLRDEFSAFRKQFE